MDHLSRDAERRQAAVGAKSNGKTA